MGLLSCSSPHPLVMALPLQLVPFAFLEVRLSSSDSQAVRFVRLGSRMHQSNKVDRMSSSPIQVFAEIDPEFEQYFFAPLN